MKALPEVSAAEKRDIVRILTVVGARPQFVKAATVSRAIQRFNTSAGRYQSIREILVHTGQHYDDNMSDIFFRELEIPSPSYHLGVGSGSHGQQTGRMLEGLERVMTKERPDLVLVYGDTNSTLAGGLAASKLHIPVAHVEAGLRSYNRAMPEEINRVLVDQLSRLLFCPTDRAVKNLSREGIFAGVHLVGDVMYDSLLYHLKPSDQTIGIPSGLGLPPGDYALATVHRADSTSQPKTLTELFLAFGRLGLPIVVPLHPRTKAAMQAIDLPPEVRIIPPVSYFEMLALERHARLILTDSGGVQKEAFLLRVPCVTLRNETEWVETVEAGWNYIAGRNPDAIVAAAVMALDCHPPDPGQPYGNGCAAETMLEILVNLYSEQWP